MDEPALFFFLFMIALIVGQSGTPALAADGQELVISSVSSNLEKGKPGTIMIEFLNNASVQSKDNELEAENSKALGITAQLISRDEQIKILSEPQVAGSLEPGTNRTLLFAAQPEKEAGTGIYLLELLVSYSNLTDIKISESQDIVFVYENATKTMPIEASVALGPDIRIEGVKDRATPGKESELEIVIANTGDQLARNVEVLLEADGLFLNSTSNSELGDLRPGDSASAKIRIKVPEDLAQGYYALPGQIRYTVNGYRRTEDTAVLVEVSNRFWPDGFLMPSLAIMLLVAGFVIAAKIYPRSKRRLKR
jgi:hypothetical protein